MTNASSGKPSRLLSALLENKSLIDVIELFSSVSVLDPHGERSPGASLMWMQRVAGEVGAELA